MINKLSTAVLLSACSACAVATTKPNVVLFLVDDMGWTDTGYSGSDLYQTPNIDKLSRDGVIFTNAYSACTVCSPTRASIVSGKYPARLHLTDWIPGYKMADAKMKLPDWRMYLPQEEVTIAEIFKASGYATGHFGKWHLGEDSIYWPENQGFDLNIGGWSKGSPNKNQKGFNGYFSPYGNPRLKDGPVGEHLTERLANEACDYMEKHQTGPFFMNVWFYNVHTPLQAKEEKIRKYEQLVKNDAHHTNPVYAAMVEHTDEAVGKIIDKLKSLGLYENTIIIFTSDNGGLLGGNNKITSNYPLRKGKGNIYEGGVRVPYIIKNAGRTPAYTNDQTPIISIDILPTLAELANLKVEDKVRDGWDGISIAPLVKERNVALKRESIFFHYPHYHSQGAKPYSAVRQGDWKLVHIIEDNQFELYNLKEDLGETQNLASKYPEKLEIMKQELARWKSEVNAQMPEFK